MDYSVRYRNILEKSDDPILGFVDSSHDAKRKV